MKKKNILDLQEIHQDRKNTRRKILEHLKKYEHLKLPGQDRLREAFRPDLDEDEYYKKNPSGEWGYRGVTRDEFELVSQKGLKTEYHKEFGRGVLFTCDPVTAHARKADGGQVVRFPFPSNAEVLIDRGPYQYDYFLAGEPIRRGELEVFLSGDVDDPDSWIPLGALR